MVVTLRHEIQRIVNAYSSRQVLWPSKCSNTQVLDLCQACLESSEEGGRAKTRVYVTSEHSGAESRRQERLGCDGREGPITKSRTSSGWELASPASAVAMLSTPAGGRSSGGAEGGGKARRSSLVCGWPLSFSSLPNQEKPATQAQYRRQRLYPHPYPLYPYLPTWPVFHTLSLLTTWYSVV
ncbi:hypothetical protein P691DRAFT_784383 [Macrolepiota fuliginosa MF-IS2]|uniref:Uncharacterized protein n=1 Tax=Macrolepiota fuliginosa MF-IS2 TaxID=1400762 RepID=A0A9P5WYZ1_9AGAR|nr:hypothetical protein P691DRAFT_784383 [Macrolepiota fuliginosa MF-IS2]